MKLGLYLMNQKGFIALKEFLKVYDSSAINYVVVSVDRNVTRDYYLEITNLCDEYSIKILEKSEVVPDNSDYKVAIGWRWIIKESNNLIVMHDSILPKYRGFSPLVNMLINGESELGVTALLASENYDQGDIIAQKTIQITYPIKIQQAIDLVSPLYAELLICIYEMLKEHNNLSVISQNEIEATYSLWRDENDYMINWSDSSEKITRFINALSQPYLGAKTYLNNELITILSVEIVDDVVIENRESGKVIFMENGMPIIVCGIGLIKITEAINNNGKSILPLKKFRSRVWS